MAQLYGPGPKAPPALVPAPDLAGLFTHDVEDRPVGELFGTLVEEETGLIRYLDLAMDGQARHVLVPIGHARVDADSVPPRVRLRAATFEDLMAVPTYEPAGTDLSPDYQDGLVEAHGRLFYGSRYYAHPAYDHRGLYAGEQPVIGPEEPRTPAGETRLRPLGELTGFRVATDEKDIRGWRVIDMKHRDMGEVDELLVDVAAKQVRYVVVYLESAERCAALPVGYLEIDTAARQVVTPSLLSEDILLVPVYEAPLTRADENRILATVEARLSGERLFDRPDFRPT